MLDIKSIKGGLCVYSFSSYWMITRNIMLTVLVVTCLGCLLEGALGTVNPLQNTTRKFNCPLPPDCPSYTEVYLTNYHYLDPFPDPDRESTVKDIETALRFFQQMNIGRLNLKVTGKCDNITKQLFTMPRCGCEDIVKGTDKKKMMMQNAIAPQAFQVGTKWSKTHLTWKVTKYPVRNRLSQGEVNDAMRRALDVWARQTTLTFQQVNPNSPSDIDIRFEVRRHAGPPYYDFDGPGNVLAHAFFPESGVVHFDDDETFVLGKEEYRTVELYIVAAHEFGHTLGLSHSNVEQALMAPYYQYKEGELLDSDDIQGVQYLYGAGDKPGVITPRPTPRPIPTTPKPSMPDYCDMNIQASFQVNGVTFVFTSETRQTVVYKVTRSGINPNSRVSIENLFKKTSRSKYPRAHPYRVDAASYIPSERKIFLFSGTRAYRYTVSSLSGPFYLDKGYPRWMKVKEEFPERPRAAVAMPMDQRGGYYMLIFGSTMVWDWDFDTQRVGAWAYPISAFGRNMPMHVHTAFLDSLEENVVFVKGDQHILFNLRYRRVLSDDKITSLKQTFFKEKCV